MRGSARIYDVRMARFVLKIEKLVARNLVPRSLADEAEGEIWPNPICIT